MELSLMKYTNLISKFQERLFLVKHEEMRYQKFNEGNWKTFHINFLELVDSENLTGGMLTSELKEIIVKTENYKLILQSNRQNVMPAFEMYFKFSKYLYSLNLRHYNFEREEQYKFNTKEFIINLRQYVQPEICTELTANVVKRKDDLDLLIKIINMKLTHFINESLKEEKFSWIMKIVVELDNDFMELNLVNQLETLESESKKVASTQHENKESEIFLNQIATIQDTFINLSRLLMESKKGHFELRLYQVIKSHKLTVHNSYPITLRHINKFIRKEANSNKLKLSINKQKEINDKLKADQAKFVKENKKAKDILKGFLSHRSFQIFFCYKCGNLLKRTEKYESTCLIDSSCKEDSRFYCLKCDCHLCLVCVIEIKNGKCSQGHLIFKYEGLYMHLCIICEETINSEGYGCNLCDVAICSKCYEVFGIHCPPKCSSCKYSLLWQKGSYLRCHMCNTPELCFWKCFFCNFGFCNKCYNPPKGYCGALHSLEQSELSKSNESCNVKYKNSVQKILGVLNLCSNCGLIPNSSRTCLRCDYSICDKCDNNNNNNNNIV